MSQLIDSSPVEIGDPCIKKAFILVHLYPTTKGQAHVHAHPYTFTNTKGVFQSPEGQPTYIVALHQALPEPIQEKLTNK